MSVSLKVSDDSVLMDKISENIFNEEVNKLFLQKIQIREIILDLVQHGDPKFGTKKFRIRVD